MQLYFPIIDKLEFVRGCILEVNGQIRVRQAQTRDFIGELEAQIGQVKTRVFAIDDYLSPHKANLEQEVRNLEQAIHHQQVDGWRDVNGLLRELRQLRKEYRAAAGALCSTQKSF